MLVPEYRASNSQEQSEFTHQTNSNNKKSNTFYGQMSGTFFMFLFFLSATKQTKKYM